MNLKFSTLFILLLSVTVFAQKKEIRQAGRAVDDGDFEEAQKLLKEVESDVDDLNKKYKGRYYLAEGQTFLGLNSGEGVTASFEGLKKAGDSFKKAIEYGEEDEGKEGIASARGVMVNSGIEDQNNQNFKDAYKKIYAAYELNKTDTIYLFAAANNAFNAEDTDKAIEYYEKLVDIGFKGNGKQYLAVEKESGEEQSFGDDEEQRDLMVKTGQYEDPSEEQDERKDGDITKQLAIAYYQKGDKDKAIETMDEAIKANPDDTELIKAQAQIYQEMDEEGKFIKIIEDLVEKDPDNAGEYYAILGDAAMKNEDQDKAKDYYEKAVEKDPEIGGAYFGIANAILGKQEAIVEEMNKLGMSDKDEKKYNELDQERNELLKEALPYVEKAYKYDKDNPNIVNMLYQINRKLKNEDEAKKYKEIMESRGEQVEQEAPEAEAQEN